MRKRVGLGVVVVSAALAAGLVALAINIVGNGEGAAAAPSTPSSGGERAPVADERCASRSFARFERPFSDPGNLVVGPFVLVGGAEHTTAAVARAFKGQKFPVLVRTGHRVRVEVAKAARSFAGLGYGPLPQGEITLSDAHKAVRFTACPLRHHTRYTFWSGAVVVHEPHCVPLDVYVDGAERPERVVLELGVRPCPSTT